MVVIVTNFISYLLKIAAAYETLQTHNVAY